MTTRPPICLNVIATLIVVILALAARPAAGQEAGAGGDPPAGVTAARAAVFEVRVQVPGDFAGGTAFFVGSDGLAVTNVHVIAKAARAAAFFRAQDGMEELSLDLEVVAARPGLDLALIRVKGAQERWKERGWAFIPVRSDDAPVGSTVHALGFPLFLPRVVQTSGIVSGRFVYEELPATMKDPDAKRDADSRWVLTTCALNRGNSGGPLIDDRGELVGVNTWGASGGEIVNAQNYSLDASHLRSLLGEAHGTPKALPHLDTFPDVTRPDSRSPAFPARRVDGDAARSVLQALNRLNTHHACLSCAGEGVERTQRVVGTRRVGAFVTRDTVTEWKTCESCKGTGYTTGKNLYSALCAVAEPLAGLGSHDPKRDQVIERGIEVLRRVGSVSPIDLAKVINEHSLQGLRMAAEGGGKPVCFVGVLRDGRVESERQFFTVKPIGDGGLVTVTGPGIASAAYGETVIVGGITRGMYVSGTTGMPLLEGAFVVSVRPRERQKQSRALPPQVRGSDIDWPNLPRSPIARPLPTFPSKAPGAPASKPPAQTPSKSVPAAKPPAKSAARPALPPRKP